MQKWTVQTSLDQLIKKLYTIDFAIEKMSHADYSIPQSMPALKAHFGDAQNLIDAFLKEAFNINSHTVERIRNILADKEMDPASIAHENLLGIPINDLKSQQKILLTGWLFCLVDELMENNNSDKTTLIAYCRFAKRSGLAHKVYERYGEVLFELMQEKGHDMSMEYFKAFGISESIAKRFQPTQLIEIALCIPAEGTRLLLPHMEVDDIETMCRLALKNNRGDILLALFDNTEGQENEKIDTVIAALRNNPPTDPNAALLWREIANASERTGPIVCTLLPDGLDIPERLGDMHAISTPKAGKWV